MAEPWEKSTIQLLNLIKNQIRAIGIQNRLIFGNLQIIRTKKMTDLFNHKLSLRLNINLIRKFAKNYHKYYTGKTILKPFFNILIGIEKRKLENLMGKIKQIKNTANRQQIDEKTYTNYFVRYQELVERIKRYEGFKPDHYLRLKRKESVLKDEISLKSRLYNKYYANMQLNSELKLEKLADLERLKTELSNVLNELGK